MADKSHQQLTIEPAAHQGYAVFEYSLGGAYRPVMLFCGPLDEALNFIENFYNNRLDVYG